MSKPKIFVTRIIPEKGLDLIREFCDMDLWPDDLPPAREELLKHVQGMDGLLCLLTDRVDSEVMEVAGKQLKVISNHAVGFDNIDIPAATARGIPVGNTPDVLTDATADFAFALLMAVARRIPEAERYVHAGKWKTWGPKLLIGVDIKGATLGLIGFGRIGQAMARRAVGFDMRVIYYDPKEVKSGQNPKAERVDFETLLKESDFISIHTPLTSDTRHLIDAEAFSKMKPNAVLINTARGPVVEFRRPLPSLESKPHLRRRPGCHRTGTHSSRQSAAEAGQCGYCPARCQCQSILPRPDVNVGCTKSDRRLER